jgi:hypothetical protein
MKFEDELAIRTKAKAVWKLKRWVVNCTFLIIF